jgi:hypothetical protein
LPPGLFRAFRHRPAGPGEQRRGGEEPEQTPLVLRAPPDIEQRRRQAAQRRIEVLEHHPPGRLPAHRLGIDHRAAHEEEQGSER